MKDYKNSARILLILSYLLFAVLFALVIFLPTGAYWYTEIKNRPDTLPIVLISTCYPCAPFAFLSILSIRKIAKNALNNKLFTKETGKSIFIFGLSCLIAGTIMLFAGFFYFPFFIASGAALFCALITKVFSDVFHIYVNDIMHVSDELEDPDETLLPPETGNESETEETKEEG